MGLRVTGEDVLMALLENDAERSFKAALREMRHGAEAIRDLARKQAPVDHGNLEQAIEVKEDRHGTNRRVRIDVGVNDDFPAPERGAGVTVGRYALYMHEGRYKLGPKSQAKQDASPDVLVGPKYLERAVDKLAPEISKRMDKAAKEAL